MYKPRLQSAIIIALFVFLMLSRAGATENDDREKLLQLVSENCLDCHSGADAEANFDLQNLTAQSLDARSLPSWIKAHDRVAAGEMPPDDRLSKEDREQYLSALFPSLVKLDKAIVQQEGRTIWRRMNRYEYENSVRELFHTPWLQIKNMLPEDGERRRFNKIGEALDISHVNMSRYMQAADYALHAVAADQALKPESTTQRYYAREQRFFKSKLRYSVFNGSPERAVFPLVNYDADTELLNNESKPLTVGESDPALRELEAFGVVASSYEPIEVRFNSFKAPKSGHYKLRFKGYTFWAAGEKKRPWRPDRTKTSVGHRSEPVVIYSVSTPRQLRRLGEFDFQVEPSVQELDVDLLEGESIQPDAVRLFRSRPPNWHNPLAMDDGMPGVAFNYMEVEGPITEEWPTRGHRLLFGNLPLEIRDKKVQVVSGNPPADAKILMANFLAQAYRADVGQEDITPLINVVNIALESDFSFSDAMLAGYTAALCSPKFICLEEPIGELDNMAVVSRLSMFLCNAAPDKRLRELAKTTQLTNHVNLRGEVQRLLQDARSQDFVDAFLAYWLDLRTVNNTSPDEMLYPDYYLDDSLVDAALAETQLFFAEIVRKNLPVSNLIDSDFIFVNERLCKHYGLPTFEGVKLRKVSLPEDSPRGGLLTQASVLKVTSNGTTTSPVIRGAWINERILGNKIPPPPTNVPAIEPDTRGATTIRHQLELHRADPSCAGCHAKMDPIGFALENFDVAGGWRDHYRSLGQEGERVAGYGKNGQPFKFRVGPIVDATGILENGDKFEDIVELKQLLLQDERAIAKNLLQQLMIYATGAEPRFSDRAEIESILDSLAEQHYRVGSMIEAIVCSELFLHK